MLRVRMQKNKKHKQKNKLTAVASLRIMSLNEKNPSTTPSTATYDMMRISGCKEIVNFISRKKGLSRQLRMIEKQKKIKKHSKRMKYV